MSEELTAKEVLQITGQICKESKCHKCPLEKFTKNENTCRISIAEHADEVIEICKQWKKNHTQFEVEWVHICRIIEGEGNEKRCVYEKEIGEDDILPFDSYDGAAEKILKEYYAEPGNHALNLYAIVERICRKVVRRCT